jgi:DNA-binding beta-propeller fold protein YncE
MTIDTKTLRVHFVARVGRDLSPPVAGDGSVFVGDNTRRQVYDFDAVTRKLIATIPAGAYPFPTAVGSELWVSNLEDGTVPRFQRLAN